MQFYWFILGALAVWRVTNLLTSEAGPWNLLLRLRTWAGHAFWGSLLDCFYCVSFWIALPVAMGLGARWREKILLWPALSGAAILLERVTVQAHTVPAASYYYEPEETNHVLRSEIDEAERSVSANS